MVVTFRDVELLAELHGLGAQLVLVQGEESAGEGKKPPVYENWLVRREPPEDLLKWLVNGGRIGLVPASVGLLVVDIDSYKTPSRMDGSAIQRARAGLPVPPETIPTPRGGSHLYFAYTGPEFLPDHTWTYGDVRSAGGYVVIYDWEATLRSARAATQPGGPDIGRITIAQLETLPDLRVGSYQEGL